jgi:hypothetical protein
LQFFSNDCPRYYAFPKKEKDAYQRHTVTEVVKGNPSTVYWIRSIALKTPGKFWIRTMVREKVGWGARIDILLHEFEPNGTCFRE